MKLLWLFIVCLGVVGAKRTHQKRSTAIVNKSLVSKRVDQRDGNFTFEQKEKAAEELLYMFGIQTPVKPVRAIPGKRPPKYMVDLYNAVADRNGKTKFPDVMKADTVRSIPNRGLECPQLCEFNLDPLEEETITDAELHIFIDKTKRSPKSSYTRTIEIYQVSPGRRQQIINQRLPLNRHGWTVFSLLSAVSFSVRKRSRYLELSIQITSSDKNDVIGRRPTSLDKQPIVVTFGYNHKVSTGAVRKKDKFDFHLKASKNLKRRRNEDIFERLIRHKRRVKKEDNPEARSTGREHPGDVISTHNQTSKALEEWKHEERNDVSSHSSKTPSYFNTFSLPSASSKGTCRRYPMYVDFEEMGWSDWIIYPREYNAYYCKGDCNFPLSKHLKPSSHATVQSIMHVLGLGKQDVGLPCCVPDTLYDINLLYFEKDNYVVLRRYEGMVAGSCACR